MKGKGFDREEKEAKEERKKLEKWVCTENALKWREAG